MYKLLLKEITTMVKNVVKCAMLAALCCVATMIIRIPTPLPNGYVNLGDCIVLLCGFTLSPLYGFLAAGVGSALADLLSGYIIYAPVTFAIKGVMALVAFGGLRFMKRRASRLISQIVSCTVAEIIMVIGYFVFEGFLYGFIPSAANIPANAMQGLAGLVLGVLLIRTFEKYKLVL